MIRFLLLFATCALLLAPAANAQRTFGTLVVVETAPAPAGPSPLSAESAPEWRFVELVYAPLYEKRAGGLSPYLASGMTPESGGKTLRVALDSRAKWSNGRAITPIDVVYTYTLAQQGKWNRAFSDLLRPVASVRQADNGFDVIIELNQVVKSPERLLTVPLIPSGLHGPLKAPDQLRPTPLAIIGAGPYTPAVRNDPTRLILNKHSRTLPKISEIQILSAGSRAYAAELVRIMGNAVTFDVDPEDAALSQREFGVRAFELPRKRLIALAYTPKSDLVSSATAKAAIKAAISRNELIAPGETTRASIAPVAQNSPGYPAELKSKRRDSIEAERIMWWSDQWIRPVDAPFFLPANAKNNKEPASFKLLVDLDDPNAMRRARIIHYRMSIAGIDAQVDPRPRLEFSSRIREGNFPTALVSLELGPKDALSPLFHSKGGKNIVRYANPEVDQLLSTGNVKAAVKKIVATAPMIFLGIERTTGLAGVNIRLSSVTGRGGLGQILRWRVR